MFENSKNIRYLSVETQCDSLRSFFTILVLGDSGLRKVSQWIFSFVALFFSKDSAHETC